MESINDRLKALRLKLRLTQCDFAEKLGLKQGTISDIERYRITVTAKTVEKAASTLNVSKDWLYTGTGEMLVQPEAIQETNQFSLNIAKSIISAIAMMGSLTHDFRSQLVNNYNIDGNSLDFMIKAYALPESAGKPISLQISVAGEILHTLDSNTK
ncbi:helix-turn-helix transcriptional regulator [Pedobacter antarcticus]|uniref:helix-turn-helix domain-containing protein n=1 Tax=Pedobacter antarcticus TaxID=34086 RepID=UPI0029303586|nr:helix-turn-helix transcriptional regulator [Pedobacter antarcticus]